MVVCNNNDLPLALTVQQVRELLGICRKGAYSLVKKEGLAIRVGEKRLVIPRERFLAYLSKQEVF
jgi:hypothetical protein